MINQMFNKPKFVGCLAPGKRLIFGFISLISAILVILGGSLTGDPAASQTINLVEQVRIKPSTVVGKPGFFQVGQSMQDRWWFIDPEGKPFFYKGVTSVGSGRGVPPSAVYPGYSEVIMQKYGKDSTAFREATYERLRRWNFNALGAWTALDLLDGDMPYTIVLDFARVGPEIKSDGVRIPDVFAPEWLKGIDRQAQTFVAPRRNNRMLVGYFTDNELGWGEIDNPDQQGKLNSDLLLTNELKPSLLQVCLSLDSHRPAYQAAWDFVLSRHNGSLETLAQDWQVNIDTPEQVRQWTNAKQAIVSRGYLADYRAFLAEFAQRYFEQSAAAIHRYDTNHLILGCRFGAPPSDAVFSAVKKPWVDVVSANNYRYQMYERMDIYYKATQLPILNGEFSWGHRVFSERPLPNEPEAGLPATERMTRNGEQALTRAWTHPSLVGYTWYRWVDQPTNKPPYLPPVSLGLVTLEDEPNRWHTDLLTKLNAQAEAIALGIN